MRIMCVCPYEGKSIAEARNTMNNFGNAVKLMLALAGKTEPIEIVNWFRPEQQFPQARNEAMARMADVLNQLACVDVVFFGIGCEADAACSLIKSQCETYGIPVAAVTMSQAAQTFLAI